MPPAEECSCGFRVRTESEKMKLPEIYIMEQVVQAHKDMALYPLTESQGHKPVVIFYKRTPENFNNSFIVDETGIVDFK